MADISHHPSECKILILTGLVYMRIQAQITENYSKDECPQVRETEELKQYMEAALRGPQEM